MSTDDTPEVIMVEVKRYDVNLSLDDLITPLTQTVDNLHAAGMVTPDSEVAQHLQTFNDLVSQLKNVVGNINSIDPNLLASKPGPPPSASTPPASPTPPTPPSPASA
jgi:hypothetical protein